MSGDLQPVRQLRATVLVNGFPGPALKWAEITGSGAFQADHFRIGVVLSPDFSLDWWDGLGAAEIDLRFSLDGGVSYTTMIVGTADRIGVDPILGVVTVAGRDLSAGLIDAHLTELFPNQRSSDIATLLATRHGLNPMVQNTGQVIGRYYQSDHSQVALGHFSRLRTEWDLLADLAKHEGYALFVLGRDLVFQPMVLQPSMVVVWDGRRGNVLSLHLRKVPALMDVQVDVQSWHSKLGQGAKATAGSGKSNTVLRANLTEDAAQKVADSVYRDLQAQARQISFEMPGELALNAGSCVRLAGRVAGWAGDYQLTTIERFFDADGYRQLVTARALPVGG